MLFGEDNSRMLLGEYNYNIDAKGRVFVPAKLREDLGDTFVIAKSMDKCISVYSYEMWARYVGKLNALPEMKARNIRRFLFSTATEVSCDSQGRVLIPQSLREHAGLEKEITFIGAGDHAEIWNPTSLGACLDEANLDDMIQILTEQGF